jgi:predicted unusual protein kinase regulating ubiquinone biosynthesis (AarF/ABC1/UbiB family)
MERSGIDREAVARTLVECYYAMFFEHRVFHADPHPGNFLVRQGPVLVFLDFGAVEEVSPALSDGMQEVLVGGISRNADQDLNGLDRMGFVAEGGDRDMLRQAGREYLRTLAGIRIDDYSKIDRGQVEKLAGFQHVRGRLRDIMRHVEYPEGYFYVERTLVLSRGSARAESWVTRGSRTHRGQSDASALCGRAGVAVERCVAFRVTSRVR